MEIPENRAKYGRSAPQPAGQNQMPAKQPKLPRLVKVFSFIFWVPAGLLVSITALLAYQAQHGYSGTEFAGFVLVPVELAVALVGLIYMVILVVYALSKGPSRRQRLFGVLALVVLLGLYGWQIAGSVRESNKIAQSQKPLTDAQVITLIDGCKVQSVQRDGSKVGLLLAEGANYDAKGNYLWQSTTASATNFDSFVAEVKKVKAKCGNIDAIDIGAEPTISYITVQQATALLQQCQINSFYYTPTGLESAPKPASGDDTGIIRREYLTSSNLYIEPGAEAVMVPTARSVQKSCGGPQFYHDGHYE